MEEMMHTFTYEDGQMVDLRDLKKGELARIVQWGSDPTYVGRFVILTKDRLQDIHHPSIHWENYQELASRSGFRLVKVTAHSIDIDVFQRMMAYTNFVYGDTVRIVGAAETQQLGWNATWLKEMDSTIGKEGKIVQKHSQHGYEVLIQGTTRYWYPPYVLVRAEKPPIEVKLSAHKALVHKDKIVVGCTTVSASEAEALIKAWKEQNK